MKKLNDHWNGQTNRRRNLGQVAGRSGAAVIELAVCLPVIVLLVAGAIECCGMIFLKQTVCAAAYEGARVAVLPDAQPRDVEQRCREGLAARQINDANITISPRNIDRLDAGDQLSVTVNAPTNANRVIPTRFVQNVVVTSAVVMLKE